MSKAEEDWNFGPAQVKVAAFLAVCGNRKLLEQAYKKL